MYSPFKIMNITSKSTMEIEAHQNILIILKIQCKKQ